MLKDLLDKGKCLIGIHQGDWMFDAPDRCDQTRTCRICGVNHSRKEHRWPEWTEATDARCESIRVCERCREDERQIVHAWSEWDYADTDGCEQVQKCVRCGSTRVEHRVAHQWEDWTYCEQFRAPIRVCRRCATRMSTFSRQPIPAAEERPAIASDAPGMDADPRVREIIHLFTAGDPPARRAFVEACPPAPMKDTVAQTASGHLDLAMMGLN